MPHKNLKLTYKILQEFEGHKPEKGVDSGKEKNSYKLVEDNEGNKFYAMDMDRTDDKLLFDIGDLPKAMQLTRNRIVSVLNEDTNEFEDIIRTEEKHPTWYKAENGYACTHGFKKENGIQETPYFHRHIVGEAFIKGKYIDHINQNKLDNRRCNLRFASQSQQNNNQQIRKGKKTIMDILQPERNKENDSKIKGLKTYFGWYGRDKLFHPLPNFIEYRKADGKFGDYFEIYTKMIQKPDAKGKMKCISFKTTKSTDLPSLYKLREGLMIRYKLIKDNWNFTEKGMFGIDGKQINDLNELRSYSREIISYFTNENPNNIDLYRCKLKKAEYVADCKRISDGISKSKDFVTKRSWRRQERITCLADMFYDLTDYRLSNTGYDNLYKLIDKYYINSKQNNIDKSTEHDDKIIKELEDDNNNYRDDGEEVNMDIVIKRNRQKYDQSKYYKKTEELDKDINDIIDDIIDDEYSDDEEYEIIRKCIIKPSKVTKNKKNKQGKNNALNSIINRNISSNNKTSKKSSKKNSNESSTKNPMVNSKIVDKQNNYNEISHKAKIARTNYFKKRTYNDDDIRDIQKIFDDGLMNKKELAQKYKIDRNVITRIVNKEINPFDTMTDSEIDEYFENNVQNKMTKKAKSNKLSDDDKKDTHAKNTSIGKRKVDLDTMIEMLKQKGKVNYKKMSTMFKNKEGEPISEYSCRAICSGRTKIYEEELENNDEFTYEDYQQIITTKAPNKKL